MTAYKAGRSGYKIDGTVHDRCTTIVGALPKPWLGAWAAKMVAEAVVSDLPFVTALIQKDATEAVRWLKSRPWDKRDKAAVRGTLVHEIAECHVEGRPLPDFTDDELPYAEAFEQFLTDHQPRFLEVETTVYDPALRVAGTFDSLAEIGGENWLLDIKTSGGVYAEYIVQLAFYMHAPLIVRADGSTEPFTHRRDRAGVVHLRPDGGYELIPLECGEDAMDVFQAALTVQRWAKAHDRWEPPAAVAAPGKEQAA